MKKISIIGILIAAIIMLGCTTQQPIGEEPDDLEEITSFEDCVAAGYPVMESYPRQCTTPDGRLFVEEIGDGWTICTEEQLNAEVCTMEYAPVCGDNGKTYSNGCMACSSGEITAYQEGECEKMSQEQAVAIAQDSECTAEGTLTEDITYNEITKTWWIDLLPNEEKEGCSPACVVDEATKTAEINWRCTGLIDRDEFCGSSTNDVCEIDADCSTTGCSGQVCAYKDAEIITTCEFRECYDNEKYGLTCGCVDGKCMWH